MKKAIYQAKWCYIWPYPQIMALLLQPLTVTDSLVIGLSPPRCFILQQTYMVCYFPWDFEGLLVTLSVTSLSRALLMASISIWKHLLCSVLLCLYCAVLQGA